MVNNGNFTEEKTVRAKVNHDVISQVLSQLVQCGLRNELNTCVYYENATNEKKSVDTYATRCIFPLLITLVYAASCEAISSHCSTLTF